MARVLFAEDYRYRPSLRPQVCIKYRAGREYTVKRECADAAIEAGAAEEILPPAKPIVGSADV